MIDARYWLSRPLTQAQRDWCRRKEPELTLACLVTLVFLIVLWVNGCTPTPSVTSIKTYQDATYSRCQFRPSEKTVMTILQANSLFADPDTFSRSVCAQLERTTIHAS